MPTAVAAMDTTTVVVLFVDVGVGE